MDEIKLAGLACAMRNGTRRSEAAKRVRGIRDIEVDIAQSDVELEMDVGVFLGELGFGSRVPGPIESFEADRQPELLIDVHSHHMVQETQGVGGDGLIRSSCSAADR